MTLSLEQRILCKEYHDKNQNVQPFCLKAGDNALIKKTGMKCTTVFDKEPVKIVKTNGSMITAQQGDRYITRNSSFFNKTNFKPSLVSDPDDQDTYDQDESDSVKPNTGGFTFSTPPKSDLPVSSPTGNNIPGTIKTTPVPIRKSTRVSQRPNRLIGTI